MSRKRYYNSYGEKLVYDNTVYYGILASADPNAEGYFKQLINFDISDTGQSLTPRKGMINSTPVFGGTDKYPLVLSPSQTVYFKDNTTGKWIFVDFSKAKVTSDVPNPIYAFMTDLSVNPDAMPDKHFHAGIISTIVDTAEKEEDIIYLKDYLDNRYDISDLYPVSIRNAQYMKDNISADRYVVKMIALKDNGYLTFWLEIAYNDKENSLIMTVVNTDTVGAITIADRNIASAQPLVPNPISVVYQSKSDAMDEGTYYDSMDTIYAEKVLSDDTEEVKTYLINYTDTLDGLKLIPSYKLIETESDEWYYTYDITSTSRYADPNSMVYRAPLFSLKDNTVLNTYSKEYIQYTYEYAVQQLVSDNSNLSTLNSRINVGINTSPTSIYNSYSINKYIGVDKLVNSSSPTSLSNVISITAVPKDRIVKTVNETAVDEAGPASVHASGEDIIINLLTFGKYVSYDGTNGHAEATHAIFEGDPSSFIKPSEWTNDYLTYNVKDLIAQLENKDSVYNTYFDYYIDDMDNISYKYGASGSTYSNTHDIQIGTPIYTSLEEPVTASKLLDRLKSSSYRGIVIKYMSQGYEIPITNKVADDVVKKPTSGTKNNSIVGTLLPDIYAGSGSYVKDGKRYNANGTSHSDDYECRRYYVYTTLKTSITQDTLWKMLTYTSLIDPLLYTYTDSHSDTYLYPCMYKTMHYDNFTIGPSAKDYLPVVSVFVNLGSMSDEHMEPYPLTNDSNIISLDIDDFKRSDLFTKLNSKRYFDNGISVAMYLIKLPKLQPSSIYEHNYMYYRDYAVLTTTLLQSRTVSLKPNSDNDKTNHITLYDDENPPRILNAREWCTFYSVEGYRLVTWTGNFVYVSEANTYHYFKESGKYSYPDRVVKVLPYKDMLLVFTTQDMYSIFPYEYTVQVQDGTNEDGTAKYVQQKMISYNTLPVLYNLHTDDRYKDVIQVYGAFVLFYSTDGQLYLISPSTQIDSDTVFTMKYMNKSANDILLNYDKYINERLDVYGKQHITKNDIIIKSSISVSYIRIFYTVPLRNYTYILSYDIVGNRFTVYDTEAFGTVHDILHSTNSLRDEVYVSNTYKGLSIVTTYVDTDDIDNNCDYITTDNYAYEKKPICTEIDTGMLYLNNQWMKRFRSLRTRYKNLDANELEYKPEFIIDDVFANTSLSDTIELRNVNGTYVTETVSHAAQLLDSNTALFDFSSFNSNKILTHTVTVPAMGKHIELRLRFKSKGRYKLNGFELIYKEHSA